MGLPRSLSFPPGDWPCDRGCVGEQWLIVSMAELGLSSAPRNEGLGVASSRNPAPVPYRMSLSLREFPHPNQGPRVRKEGQGQMALDLRLPKLRMNRRQSLQPGSPSSRALHRMGADEWGPEKQRRGQAPMALLAFFPPRLHGSTLLLFFTKTALFVVAHDAQGAGPWEATSQAPTAPQEGPVPLPPPPSLPLPFSVGRRQLGRGWPRERLARVIVPSREFGAMWERH